jgi:hypothetical protein
MAKRMTKTIQAWDNYNVNYSKEHEDLGLSIARALFGYRCRFQASIRYSPFMILTGWTSKLKVNNHLSMLTHTFDEEQNFK